MHGLLKYLSLLLLANILALGLSAQGILDQKLDFTADQKDLSTALYELSLQSGINISFGNYPQLSKKQISVRFRNRSLKFILQELLKSTDLGFRQIGQQIVLYRRPPKPERRYTIRGFVEDNFNAEKLIAANIYDPDSYRGTSTNYYGFYSLTLPAGPTKLTYSYLGYVPQIIQFNLAKDTLINISLQGDFTLAEIVVVGSDSLSANKFGHISQEDISLDQVKKLPSLGGEPDVLRTAFLLSGVQSGGDGVGGLFIRGGNADQNLVLLDGVPVYNATHLVGSFPFSTAVLSDRPT